MFDFSFLERFVCTFNGMRTIERAWQRGARGAGSARRPGQKEHGGRGRTGGQHDVAHDALDAPCLAVLHELDARRGERACLLRGEHAAHERAREHLEVRAVEGRVEVALQWREVGGISNF